jgi:hypothetical protein
MNHYPKTEGFSAFSSMDGSWVAMDSIKTRFPRLAGEKYRAKRDKPCQIEDLKPETE